MQVLTVDIGTGTQDILLYDSKKSIENNFEMVLPSPTVRLAQQVKAATAAGKGLLITGVLMGGGPVGWAVRDHAQSGLPVYSLPDPARTFDDDLTEVEEMGIRLVSEDEAAALTRNNSGLEFLRFGDFDYDSIKANFERFGITLSPDAIALAVFDHGAAPPGISDRTFRFDYIRQRLEQENNLAAFAFLDDNIPERLTRFEAVARTARPFLETSKPLLLMDTGPAAALGSMDDPFVAAMVEKGTALLTNLGNFHALAFLLEKGKIIGTFEHHTGELETQQLEEFLISLSAGILSNEDIFGSQGHGALYLQKPTAGPEFLAVTGPRRGMLRNRTLKLQTHTLEPYYAVPNGAMMLAGNYGMLHALEYRCPSLELDLESALKAYSAPNW